jgi:hypothetical protein
MSLRVFFLISAFALLANANSLTVSASSASQFSPLSAATVDRNGFPFWDQPSLDGGDRNVGYFFTGSGAVFGPLPARSDEYFHNGSNGVTGFSFSGGGSFTVATFLLEVAGRRDVNSAGWYEMGNPSNRQTFIAGPDNPSHTPIVFSTPTHFGIFLMTTGGQEFRSENAGQFALFRDSSSGTFFVAIEDLVSPSGEGGIGDFNDLVFSLSRLATQEPIPEPGTLGLTAMALLAAAACRQRIAKSRAR